MAAGPPPKTHPSMAIDLKTKNYFRIRRLGEFSSQTTQMFEGMIRDAIVDDDMLAIVAPYGSGKTHLLGRVKKMLAAEGVTVLWSDVRDESGILKSGSIMQSLATDLCGEHEQPRRSAEARARQIERLLGTSKVQHGRRTCLIIEDAHRLELSAIDSLKRLREKDFNGVSPLLSIVLVGWPSLDAKLERRRDLLTRMTRIHLDESEGWMTHSERVAYLEARYPDIIDAETRERIATRYTVPVEMDHAIEEGLYQARLAGYDRLDDRIIAPELGELYERLKLKGVSLADIAGAAGGIAKSSVSDAIAGKGPHVDAVAAGMQRLAASGDGAVRPITPIRPLEPSPVA